MSDVEQKKLGLRIRAVRVLTGMNQQEFSEACSFNHTSLRNWEFGRVSPRKDAIDRLIESFQSYSIHVNKEWLIFGKGEGPIFTESITQKKAVDPKLRNEFLAFKDTCAAMGENAIVAKVSDDAMSPHYCSGDWIGGIACSLKGLHEKANIQQFLDKPLLVKTSDKEFKIRRILHDGERWLATNERSHLLEKIVSDVAGIIVMHVSFKEFLPAATNMR
jgi:transcriptional regulator with XRE-family HTH domain